MPFNKLFILPILLVFLSCKEQKAEQDASPGSAFLSNDFSNDFTEFVHLDSLYLNPNKGLVYNKGEVFSGLAKTFYPNNISASEIQYSNGKRHGLSKKYFPSGELSFSAQYKKGKKNGLSSTWWSNGNIRSESNFLEGKPNGIQKQWYKTGAIFKILNLVDGHEDGKQQSWRENGKVYSNYQAINGRIFGLKRANLCYKLDDEEVQTNN